MEFEGVVYKIMPVTRGTSARGEWQRQDVVFDYNDGGQFSRKICVTFFNKESDVAKLREGETFLVSVNIESREYNGRWYTDIRAWRVQPKQQQPPVPMTDAPLPSDIPAAGGPCGGGAAAAGDDRPASAGGGGYLYRTAGGVLFKLRPPSVSCTVAAVRSPSWYEGSGYFSVVLPSIPNVETITIFSSMLFGFETVMPYSPTGDSSSVR